MELLASIPDLEKINSWKDEDYVKNIPVIWHTQPKNARLKILGGKLDPVPIKKPEVETGAEDGDDEGDKETAIGAWCISTARESPMRRADTIRCMDGNDPPGEGA